MEWRHRTAPLAAANMSNSRSGGMGHQRSEEREVEWAEKKADGWMDGSWKSNTSIFSFLFVEGECSME